MNGRETAAAEHVIENRRAVHLIDAVAIRNALLGSTVALTELERGAVIAICDLHGLDRDLTAAGLGTNREAVDKAIARRRRSAGYAYRAALAAGMREPALDLVDAVRERNVVAVAEVVTVLDTQGLYALAIVLADLVADVRDPANPIEDPINSRNPQ